MYVFVASIRQTVCFVRLVVAVTLPPFLLLSAVYNLCWAIEQKRAISIWIDRRN